MLRQLQGQKWLDVDRTRTRYCAAGVQTRQLKPQWRLPAGTGLRQRESDGTTRATFRLRVLKAAPPGAARYS